MTTTKPCAICQEHYGDNGPCDEGKPVNSPHRAQETRKPIRFIGGRDGRFINAQADSYRFGPF